MDLPFINPFPLQQGTGPFGPESGATVLGLTFATLGLEIICVGLRLYTRLFMLRQPGWDDLCVFLGCLCTIGISVVAHYMVKELLPGGMASLSFDYLTKYLKGNYISLGIFPICMGFIKAALMLQFRRIFDVKSAAHRFSTVVLVVVILWSVAFGAISLFPCSPVSKVWDPFMDGGHCYGLGSPVLDRPTYLKTLIVQAASNMFLDLVILGLATYLMKGSGPGRTGFNIRLGALIVIGLLANMCAIAKTVFVVKMLQEGQNLTDPAQVMPWGVTLLTCEVNLAAICASVPVFWGPMQEAVRERWDNIFVTKEVTVVHSARYRNGDHGDDERDLTQPTISRSDSTSTDVDVEMSNMAAEQQKNNQSHYKDEFVQTYISPLRNNNERLGGTTVRSEPRRTRKWYNLG